MALLGALGGLANTFVGGLGGSLGGGLLGGGAVPSGASGGPVSVGGDTVSIGGGGVGEAFSQLNRRNPFAGAAVMIAAVFGVVWLIGRIIR